MCEFVTAEQNVMIDSAIPKALREAIRQRRRLAMELQHTIVQGITPKVFDLVERLADLNRSIRNRDWLPRVPVSQPTELEA